MFVSPYLLSHDKLIDLIASVEKPCCLEREGFPDALCNRILDSIRKATATPRSYFRFQPPTILSFTSCS